MIVEDLQIYCLSPESGVNLYVRERGGTESGGTLLLLHNFGGSALWWNSLLTALPNTRLIMPDLRGFGESDEQTPDVTYTVDDMANDILFIAETLGLTGYTLVGHSMGGKVALAAAARNPAGLRELRLLAPSPPTPEPMEADARQKFLESHHSRDAALALIGKISHAPLSPEQTERVIADQLRTSDAAWAAWIERGSREDISGRMGNVQVPVRILSGDADGAIALPVIRQEVAERLNVPLQVVPDVGHLLLFEAQNIVTEFLRSE